MRDESMFHDAEMFSPDRFLKNGQLDKEIFDPRTIAFGFGRR